VHFEAAVALPVSAIVCEAGAALLTATVMLAFAVAVPVGVNVTEILQEDDAASVVPHVVVIANRAASVPPSVIPLRFSVAFPWLLRVTSCGVLVEFVATPLNVRVALDNVAVGAVVTPLPPDPPPHPSSPKTASRNIRPRDPR
jgi:hypothetical protein